MKPHFNPFDLHGPSAYDGIPSSYRFKKGDTVAAMDRDLERGMDLQHRFLAYADVFWRHGGMVPNFEALMRDLGLTALAESDV